MSLLCEYCLSDIEYLMEFETSGADTLAQKINRMNFEARRAATIHHGKALCYQHYIDAKRAERLEQTNKMAVSMSMLEGENK